MRERFHYVRDLHSRRQLNGFHCIGLLHVGTRRAWPDTFLKKENRSLFSERKCSYNLINH